VKRLGKSPSSGEQDSLAEILHQFSQPLSVLECGLELSLLHDRTPADFRRRMKVLLEAAQALHQHLAKLRQDNEVVANPSGVCPPALPAIDS
jgi:hypothetical protein